MKIRSRRFLKTVMINDETTGASSPNTMPTLEANGAGRLAATKLKRSIVVNDARFGWLAMGTGTKKVRRLSTFRWRNMECFTHWSTGWWGRGIRATHARTGVLLTVVPQLRPRPHEMAHAISRAEDYARETLRSDSRKLARYPVLPITKRSGRARLVERSDLTRRS